MFLSTPYPSWIMTEVTATAASFSTLTYHDQQLNSHDSRAKIQGLWAEGKQEGNGQCDHRGPGASGGWNAMKIAVSSHGLTG